MSQKITPERFDVAIVGAGINGSVAAAALSSRGLKVLLVDGQDFGAVTSSQSSNLIWGGIKYLQSYEFGLVFKLCRARLRLMRSYPTSVRSTGFLAALGPNAPFGKFLGTLGTLSYWAIGIFKTPPPRTFGTRATHQIEPAMGGAKLKGSVLYFDAMLPDNDSRFVWGFVAKAKALGATVRNYVELKAAEKIPDGFALQLTDTLTNEQLEVETTIIVNAAGPYVRAVNNLLSVETKNQLLYSKGIHLVVRKLTDDQKILAFWDEEGRIFYVIPMHDRSVIGTTDTRVSDPAESVTDEDRNFVLRQINASMNLDKPLSAGDIISERCGVRALVVKKGSNSNTQDWHKLSRKHFVESNPAGVISILGGKFTDCLNVGEEILQEVSKFIPLGAKSQNWIGEDSQAALRSFSDLAAAILGDSADAREVASQLWRRHGLVAVEILKHLKAFPSDRDLVFDGLFITFGELMFVAESESIRTPADLLRRRLPISMVRSESEIQANARLQQFLKNLGPS